jgi:vancomycin resistance protein YoaR
MNSLTNKLPKNLQGFNHKLWAWLLIVVASFALICLLLLITAWILQLTYRDRYWPSVSIADVNLGGKPYQVGSDQLQAKIDSVNNQGFTYTSDVKTIKIYPTTVAPGDPDISHQLVSWHTQKALDQAWAIGKSSNPLITIRDAFGLITGRSFDVPFDWTQEEFMSVLRDSFAGTVTEKKEATLIFDQNQPVITSEATGVTFNFDQALKQTAIQIAQLNTQEIRLEKKIEQPAITRAKLLPLLPQVTAALNFTEYALTTDKNRYLITPTLLRRWLTFVPNGNSAPQLTINLAAMDEWLGSIRSEVEKPAQNAKFAINNGRVTEFQANQDGISIDTDQLQKNLTQNLPLHQDVALPIKTEKAQNTISQANNLGITALLGTGTSDFSGSPKNRRHNIRVGATAVNGSLIAPGEEFSLLKTLGTIDGSTGYLQELVIKGDKTTPEYGGGLCQIGTTTFRATMAAGLPVTERRNHSYRVRYYEPAGTDATIYDPAPDYKFKNDTGNYILIQTRVDDEHSKLYFDFWGTPDGRKVTQTEPEIYNIVPPGPGKLIETLDLPVGTKKCTEVAHSGADAKFDYTITYANGQADKTTFKSHYVPWQEVCLIGVDHLTATTTPDGSAAGSDGGVIINSLN